MQTFLPLAVAICKLIKMAYNRTKVMTESCPLIHFSIRYFIYFNKYITDQLCDITAKLQYHIQTQLV